MSKKDFSKDTSNVFDNFFSLPGEQNNTSTESNEKIIQSTENIIEKKENIAKTTSVPENIHKTKDKSCRCNFYIDLELKDFVNNYVWLRRKKNISQYMNYLIKKDLLEFLDLPQNSSSDEIIRSWEQYKKDNDL